MPRWRPILHATSWNGDGGDNQDRDNRQAKIAERKAGDGHAAPGEPASAAANIRQREMTHDDADNGGRQKEKQNAADQASDRFAAGLRLNRDRG
jgi:hypothetical protein